MLIAFVVFATWDDYDKAKINSDTEANTIHDLFLNSHGLPEEFQPQIKAKILEYLNEVIEDEWDSLAVGKANHQSKEILVDLWKIYMDMDSLHNDKQKAIFAESISKLNDITDARRMRILDSQNHIPDIIWIVIIFGALTSVGFSLFFGTKSFAIQVTMTSLFTITNVIIILMILNLDNPFSGDAKITPEPFEYVQKYIKEYQSK